jgi:hypothetical protein
MTVNPYGKSMHDVEKTLLPGDAPSRWHRTLRCGWLAAFTLLITQLASSIATAQSATREVNGSARAKTASRTATKDAKLGTDWVRLNHDDEGELQGMQTAIVRYVGAGPKTAGAAGAVQVDLVGAVHIADVAYYRELNDRFKEYDALLYELVAPEGTVVQRGRGTSNAHPVGAMQNGIKALLELDHQLEEIDYTKSNFVHADMSPDQFVQSMKDRNESFLQMYFRLLGQAMAHQSEMEAKGQSLDFDLLSALFATDRPRRLKIALAKQLAEMESLMVSLGGEEGSVLISERNKIALKVLKQQLAAGKERVGIFYGAGHLNDMDERIRKEFGLQPTEITWVTAWNLATKP